MNMIFVWAAVLVCSLAVELFTYALVAIWFAPSALVCMLLAALKLPVGIQITTFIVLSALFLIFIAQKLRDNIRNKSEKTNLDAIIGSLGIVETEILPDSIGRVKVKSQSWSAISQNNEKIEQGAHVRILKIEGVKLICEKTDAE